MPINILLFCLLFFCLLSSCSTVTDSKDEILEENADEFAEPSAQNTSFWFKDQKYVYWSNFEDEIFHPFFDYGALIGKDLVKAFVVTPKGSEIKYGFDLVSGQIYNDFKFCSLKDIKNKYSGTLDRPDFSFAIVPRLLDHMGQPQEIVVFGNPEYEKSFSSEQSSYYAQNRINLSQIDVKIIGASVLKYCPKPSCQLVSDWKSKLILIGATKDDRSFDQDIESFIKTDRYQYLKSFMENMRGHYQFNDRISVSYHFEGAIDPVKALQFSIEKGHLFKEAELNTLKNSCLNLYDNLWDQTKKFKNTGKWRKAFLAFFTKHRSHLSTCLKYIAAGNINQDYERHWFFAYLKAMTTMPELDNFYLCDKNAWIENPRDGRGKLQYDFMNEYMRCSSKSIEDSFEASVMGLRQLQQNKKDYLKYITYDFGYYGSHKKIYSWVPHELHQRSCGEENKTEINVFPQDLRWGRIDSPNTTRKFEMIK